MRYLAGLLPIPRGRLGRSLIYRSSDIHTRAMAMESNIAGCSFQNYLENGFWIIHSTSVIWADPQCLFGGKIVRLPLQNLQGQIQTSQVYQKTFHIIKQVPKNMRNTAHPSNTAHHQTSTMARKKAEHNLQRFLRKEVEKRKIKIPDSDPEPSRPSRSANVADDPSDMDEPLGKDVDSLFGDPLGTPSIKEQEMKAKIAQLLATETSTATPKFTESETLLELREELKVLVLMEAGGNIAIRERRLLERQKGPLIEEIRYIMELERAAYERMSFSDTPKEIPTDILTNIRANKEQGLPTASDRWREARY